ncbi:M23 family metallopeptidase [Micromonospora sp. WMMD980]|uniref:M23 family metallopeptidase n=1 Tax=Micromonospora sp. WMMD980 TaxID=3016088 RepID=UPI002416A0FC|nr:M23 family metallopeptidase [Micromonospora sp. WMMD980]MDG4802360.1 M23 family metallopeptidase [Micromonospora sp. WMMD980]
MRFPTGPTMLLTLLLVPGAPVGPVAPPVGTPRVAVRPAPPSPSAVPPSSVGPIAGATSPSPTSAAPRFRWPLPGPPRLARRFAPPPEPWLAGHRGVDLVAEPGAEIRAAGAGTVLFAGPVAGRPVVTVGHGDGLRTTYEPVRPRLAVGDPVDAGTPVGDLLAGHPGCAAPACLHWGLRRGDVYLDPLALLGLGRVRLLPLDPPPPAGP